MKVPLDQCLHFAKSSQRFNVALQRHVKNVNEKLNETKDFDTCWWCTFILKY